MALGGGTFTIQNKTLPGAYINFISTTSASSTLADRGVATMPLSLDWGADNEIFKVENSDFIKNSLKIFGYSYSDDSLKGIKDIFKNCNTLYIYRLNSGEKSTNEFAVAKYSGIRGNDIKITISNNVDYDNKYDVSTLLDTTTYDTQTVENINELVSNDYVEFKKDFELVEVLAKPLTGGTNSDVTGLNHQNYLSKIEKYSFNVMGVVTVDDNIKSLYSTFCKRMRDEVGSKFQLVLHSYSSDYEGVVNVINNTVIKSANYTYEDLEDSLHEDTEENLHEELGGEYSLNELASVVYWVTGIICGCAVNKSNTNKLYTGEFEINTDYTQSELAYSINTGEFVLHQVGDDIRVLEDIHSLITTSIEKNNIFKDNQSIRVIDQIANDLAVLFITKYLGVIPNNDSGRISFWSDIVKHHETLENIGAIENFNENDVKVEQGNTKKEVVVADAVTVVNSMNKLYMTE